LGLNWCCGLGLASHEGGEAQQRSGDCGDEGCAAVHYPAQIRWLEVMDFSPGISSAKVGKEFRGFGVDDVKI